MRQKTMTQHKPLRDTATYPPSKYKQFRIFAIQKELACRGNADILYIILIDVRVKEVVTEPLLVIEKRRSISLSGTPQVVIFTSVACCQSWASCSVLHDSG